ncbi:10394_t:CDS:2, partial [Cetraspora pellucida]
TMSESSEHEFSNEAIYIEPVLFQILDENQDRYEFSDKFSYSELVAKTDVFLYSEKRFSTWNICEKYLNEWAEEQGFYIVKDRVHRNENIVHRQTFLYEHSHSYDSISNKNTKTKKMQCLFLINASCLKINNPEGSVIVNKIIFDYNYPVNYELVEFENAKKFTNLMLEDIKFMT